MRLPFWLLDIARAQGNLGPEIWLWGVTKRSEKVLVIDDTFLPHLYVTASDGSSVKDVAASIEDTFSERIGKLESVHKRFFGKPVDAVKVEARRPEELEHLAKSLAGIPSVKAVFEHDVRYAMQYLLERSISPCQWMEAEVEEVELARSGLRRYRATSSPHAIQGESVPKLKQIAVHAIMLSRKGTPRPDENPIAVLSLKTSEGACKQIVSEGEDDSNLITEFIDYIEGEDPDIIFGFGSNRVFWNYATRRANARDIKLDVGRSEGEPHPSAYGHISISGRINVDLSELAEGISGIELNTLESMADYLGTKKLDDWEVIEQQEVYRYWESQKGKLLVFGAEAASCTLEIGRSFMEYLIELSRLTGIPMDHVATAATGFKVEWYLAREAVARDEIIPERIERPYFPYAGGVVVEPAPGMHEDIAVLDFKSMYPSLMVAYNISPDTLLGASAKPPGKFYEAPEVGYRFLAEPPGLYKSALANLLRAREGIRSLLKAGELGKVERKILDARQAAMKVVANACYGYAGWIGARWYRKEVAEATAAWGRATIREAMELCRRTKLELIYGDTDSLFVKNEPEKLERVLESVEKDFGLEIRVERIYRRTIFTEAKKRYAGLTDDGIVEIVGLEAVRGDYPNVARKAQRGVLEAVLRNPTDQIAVTEAARALEDRVRSGSFPYKDFVIWKEISRDLDNYKVKTAHVEAAKRLLKEGWQINRGDKVGYVIVKGSGQLYERSIPYFMTIEADLDLEYYLTNLVLPPIMRVLSAAGIRTSEAVKRGRGLFDYSE